MKMVLATIWNLCRVCSALGLVLCFTLLPSPCPPAQLSQQEGLTYFVLLSLAQARALPAAPLVGGESLQNDDSNLLSPLQYRLKSLGPLNSMRCPSSFPPCVFLVLFQHCCIFHYLRFFFLVTLVGPWEVPTSWSQNPEPLSLLRLEELDVSGSCRATSIQLSYFFL